MTNRQPLSDAFFHVGVVIRHGVQTVLSSLAAASNAPASWTKLPNPMPVSPLVSRPPLLLLANSALAVGATVAAAAAVVVAAEVSDVGHLAG